MAYRLNQNQIGFSVYSSQNWLNETLILSWLYAILETLILKILTALQSVISVAEFEQWQSFENWNLNLKTTVNNSTVSRHKDLETVWYSD